METAGWTGALILVAALACGGGGGHQADAAGTSSATSQTTFPGKFRPLASETAVKTATAPPKVETATAGLTSSHMQVARAFHRSALLPDGRVLVYGGLNNDGAAQGAGSTLLLSSDMFDPVTESFSPGPNLQFSRTRRGQSAQFSDGLLIYGDVGLFTPDEFLHFDTMTTELLPLPPFNTPPYGGCWEGNAWLLPDRLHILVMGASTSTVLNMTPQSLDEVVPPYIYNFRTGERTWVGTDNPRNYFRREAGFATLRDGTVLIVGGYCDYKNAIGVPAMTALVFDPATLQFRETGPLTMARVHHSVLPLPDGRVGIYGGVFQGDGGGRFYHTNSVELYNPATHGFTVAKPTGIDLESPESLVLPSGLTMHTGGLNPYEVNTTVFLHDAARDQSGLTGTMVDAAYGRSLIRMNNGKVVVSGGVALTHTTGIQPILDRAEIFEPEGPITLSYPADVLRFGQSMRFSAQASFEVVWTCTAGTISETGTYTAPAQVGEAWIRASRKGDPTVYAQGKVSIIDVNPANLSYQNNPCTYVVNVPIQANAPSVQGGKPEGYRINPSLPAGLVLDPKTGVLSGTPTTPVPAQPYLVTAYNSGGSAHTTLVLQVDAP